jgi:predicted protein tyrosine phosphatase
MEWKTTIFFQRRYHTRKLIHSILEAQMVYISLCVSREYNFLSKTSLINLIHLKKSNCLHEKFTHLNIL